MFRLCFTNDRFSTVQNDCISDGLRDRDTSLTLSAQRSAHIEEERVRRQQAEKVDRLQAFQEGVRQRMQLLAVAKRARQCQKSYTPVSSNFTTCGIAHHTSYANIICTHWYLQIVMYSSPQLLTAYMHLKHCLHFMFIQAG